MKFEIIAKKKNELKELSKRLKELGFDLETIFYWKGNKMNIDKTN